jgi:hypothetical protein
MYTPDNWVVVKLPSCYKLFSGWTGGYLGADQWRLNSGITYCYMEQDGDYYFFTGFSGSTYRCHKDSYGLRMNNAQMFNEFQSQLGEENFKMMPENTEWTTIEWNRDTE